MCESCITRIWFGEALRDDSREFVAAEGAVFVGQYISRGRGTCEVHTQASVFIKGAPFQLTKVHTVTTQAGNAARVDGRIYTAEVASMADLQKINTNTLHWWVVNAAAVSLAAPMVTDWAFVVQVAALAFGVVAFFRVTGGRARAVIATAVVILGVILIAQVVGGLVASSLESSFTDDSVQIGSLWLVGVPVARG